VGCYGAATGKVSTGANSLSKSEATHALVMNFGQKCSPGHWTVVVARMILQQSACCCTDLCCCCCCTCCSPAGVNYFTHLYVVGCLHRTDVGSPGVGYDKAFQPTLHAIPSTTYPFVSKMDSPTRKILHGLGSTRGRLDLWFDAIVLYSTYVAGQYCTHSSLTH